MEWFGTALEVKILNNRRKSNSSGFKLVREKNVTRKVTTLSELVGEIESEAGYETTILMILGVLFKISHELATPENTS